jgi:mRNA interferase HicA
MKGRDLRKKLGEYGWYFLREGSDHEIWSNGEVIEPIPRHREVSEYLARKILRRAKNNPGRK